MIKYFQNKSFFIFFLIIIFFLLYNRYVWSEISQWQVDEASNMWIALTKSFKNITVGLISSKGLPNPNGMVILGKFLSYFPSLLYVSFFISFTQLFLISIFSYLIFKIEKNIFVFISVFLSLSISIALSSTSAHFSNQWMLVHVNLVFMIIVISYILKPTIDRILLIFFPIILAPSIYLAGLANAVSFLICGLLLFFWKKPEFKKKKFYFTLFALFIFIALSIYFTWVPYFQEIVNKKIIISSSDNSYIEKIKSTFLVIFKFPYWLTRYGAGELSGTFNHNGFESVSYPFWSIFRLSSEGWSWYKKFGSIISSQSIFWLRFSSTILVLQSFFSLIVFFFLVYKKNKKPDQLSKSQVKYINIVSIILLYVLINLIVADVLGSPKWIDGQRLDQQIQFLPCLIFFWFLVPLVINFEKKNKIKVLFIFVFICFFIGNVISFYRVSHDHVNYNGNIITESDVPLIQKQEALKYIADDWNKNLKNKTIYLYYYFPHYRWNWIEKFSAKLSLYYPNVFTLGREYDYDLLKIYNFQNGFNMENSKNVLNSNYIITYNFVKVNIEDKYFEDEKIINRLKVIKLKKQ